MESGAVQFCDIVYSFQIRPTTRSPRKCIGSSVLAPTSSTVKCMLTFRPMSFFQASRTPASKLVASPFYSDTTAASNGRYLVGSFQNGGYRIQHRCRPFCAPDLIVQRDRCRGCATTSSYGRSRTTLAPLHAPPLNERSRDGRWRVYW